MHAAEIEASGTQGLTTNLSAKCNPQQQSHANPLEEAAETILRQLGPHSVIYSL